MSKAIITLTYICYDGVMEQSPKFKEFGNFIRERRKALHLTQIDLARKVVVTQGYITRLENGHYQPSKEVIDLLAKSLMIKTQVLYSLIGGTGEEFSDWEAAKAEYESIPPEHRKLAREFMRMLAAHFQAPVQLFDEHDEQIIEELERELDREVGNKSVK